MKEGDAVETDCKVTLHCGTSVASWNQPLPNSPQIDVFDQVSLCFEIGFSGLNVLTDLHCRGRDNDFMSSWSREIQMGINLICAELAV